MDGSTPLSYGSGFKFGSSFLLFEGTFASVLKDKKSYRIHKTVGETKVFHTFFLDYVRIRKRTKITDPDTEGQKACGSHGSGSVTQVKSMGTTSTGM